MFVIFVRCDVHETSGVHSSAVISVSVVTGQFDVSPDDWRHVNPLVSLLGDLKYLAYASVEISALLILKGN